MIVLMGNAVLMTLGTVKKKVHELDAAAFILIWP